MKRFSSMKWISNHVGGFGLWFELDWTDRPNHSMAVRHVVLAERKLMTYVYAVAESLQSWYQSGFPAIRFHSSAANATVFFRRTRDSYGCMDELLISDYLRYGPLPGEGLDMPYRDPEIYDDMYRRRYVSYVAA
ncbi:hypothetical protein TIFTF001_014275 [Ficus carica]|uniref:Uncharacterized protein n=1 Tax=Ficus carica TaxID=3494 RepID=A0AA88D3V6_FICCA|nr:hypothetical protein TIFTF001_014275 [Ficus carica]